MESLVWTTHVIAAVAIIVLVLMQQGKGADMGASFGAGASATIFGSSGSGNFLTKSTSILAVAFFVISLLLGNLTANRVKSTDEWNNLANPTAEKTIEQTNAPVKSAEPTAVKNTDVPATAEKKNNGDVPK